MRWAYVSFVLGLLLCLICAFLIGEGNILEENNTAWAIVIGIVGIGLIFTSGACISFGQRNKWIRNAVKK
jgi:hypothetical protein